MSWIAKLVVVLLGKNALHMATYMGCDSVVRDDEGFTALHLAIWHSTNFRSKIEIFKLLLAANPSLGLIPNFAGTTALMQAASDGHFEMVKLLLAACPETLDLVDQHQSTALLYAASKHRFEIINLLLAAKPRNIRAADRSNWNVLHYCVSSSHGHAEIVEKILAIDPSLIRTRNSSRQTPLWLAVDKGCDNELIENLFHRFPLAMHMTDGSGRAAHDMAVEHNNDFAMKFFKENC